MVHSGAFSGIGCVCLNCFGASTLIYVDLALALVLFLVGAAGAMSERNGLCLLALSS